MRPRVLNISPYSVADIDAIATVQTPGAGGVQELTLDGVLVTGGVAIMDFPRQVTLDFNDDDRARVLVVTGTDSKGNQLVEAVHGVDTDITSTVMAFTTVTSIKIDDDSVGNIEAGVGAVVSTNWLPLDYLVRDFQVALGITVHAAVVADVTVELTLFNLLARRGNDPQPQVGSWLGSEFGLFFPDEIQGNETRHIFDHDSLVNVTADQTGNLAFPVRAIRLTSNAVMTGGAAGVDLEVVQAAHGQS